MSMRWFYLLPFLMLFGCRPASAATYYVDGAAGSDANSGAAADKPFKTIAHAAAVSRPGDEVLVAPGAYDESVSVGGYPDAADRTVFRSEQVGKALLTGTETRVRFVIHRPRVSLIGFQCSKSTEHAIEFQQQSDQGLVDRCLLLDNKLDGVFFINCKGSRVQNCVAARNGRFGIWFLHDNDGTAVSNTLVSNRGAGVSAVDTPGVIVFDTLFSGNGVGISCSGTAIGALRSDHNLFNGFVGSGFPAPWPDGASAGTLRDWQDLTGQDPDSVYTDALLADPDHDDFAPRTPPAGNWSPALREGLRVDSFDGALAPGSDLNDLAPGPGVGRAVGAIWVKPPAPGKSIGTASMPFEGQLSVGIYDGDGQIVRTLLSAYPAHKGPRPLYWDGKDNLGQVAPPGKYEWRAIAHNVHGVDDGSVGDGGKPPWGKWEISDSVNGLAVDQTGALYEISFWNEAGHGLRKLTADGTADWVIPYYIRNVAGGYGTAVATDGKYVFAALARNNREANGGRYIRDDIRRVSAADGSPANFLADGKPENLITVNPEKPDPWIPSQNLTDDASRRMFGIHGMALDDRRLFVSNYYAGRIEVYDKETGQKLSQFDVDRPLGIAAAPAGDLWVANSGDRVTEFTPEGVRKHEIAGLKDPFAVAIGGPEKLLFVTELGPGKIEEYALDTAGPRLLRSLGHAAPEPGPVESDGFRWGGASALAVDAQGRLSVADNGNHRVQRFLPDGKLWQSLYSDFVSAPFVDARDPDVLLSGTRQYHVNYTTGAWEFTDNWAPNDGKFSTDFVVKRRLPNGRDYLFHLGGHRMGVVIYAVENNHLRRSAMLGGRWMGTDDMGKGGIPGRYFWIDSNGNGVVEDDEITWDVKPETTYGMVGLAPGWWVDEGGNLWLADAVTHSILRLKLLGFDDHNNPRYDWTQRETVVPQDTGPWKLMPTNLKIAPGGDIYVQGSTALNHDTGPFWMGGTAVARYSPAGKRLWILPLPNVAVSTATDGQFWFTGEGPGARGSMYTDDGLFLTSMTPGKPGGYTSGWIDHAMGIYAFYHPGTKTHYVYAEEDLYGKSIRYRIEGVASIKRLQGTFNWPP